MFRPGLAASPSAQHRGRSCGGIEPPQETQIDLRRSGLLFLFLGTAAASAQEKAATPPAQTQPASSTGTARKRSSDDAGKEKADAVTEREAERRAERRERRRERRHGK
jgi:hypothetical protein